MSRKPKPVVRFRGMCPQGRPIYEHPEPAGAAVGVEGVPKGWNPCSRCLAQGKSDDCERCGGSGWRKKCNSLDCLEYGCNGYGFCLVTKDELAAALAQQPADCPHRELCECIGACKHGMAGSGATEAAAAPQPAAEAIELTVCCGREECGGECGNEWRGMEWVRKDMLPPAEAQAQGGGEVAMEAWNAALNDAGELRTNAPDGRYERRAQNVEAWIRGNRPSPTSAPVGVEAIAAEIRASLGRGATVSTRRRWAVELEALAQQPVFAPCCMCGNPVDARENGTPGAELSDGRWTCSHECFDKAVGEQPAAVDETQLRDSTRYRFLRNATDPGFDVIDAFQEGGEELDAAVDAALAAQQGERA